MSSGAFASGAVGAGVSASPRAVAAAQAAGCCPHLAAIARPEESLATPRSEALAAARRRFLGQSVFSYRVSRRTQPSSASFPEGRSDGTARAVSAVASAARASESGTDQKVFLKLAEEGYAVLPVWETIPFELTSYGAFEALAPHFHPDTGPFFLDTLMASKNPKRYSASFMGFDPAVEVLVSETDGAVSVLRHRIDGKKQVTTSIRDGAQITASQSEDPVVVAMKLEDEFSRPDNERVGLPEGAIVGGWMGYKDVETVKRQEATPSGILPRSRFALYRKTVVFDNVRREAYAISWVFVDEHASAKAAYSHAVAELETMTSWLQGASSSSAASSSKAVLARLPQSIKDGMAGIRLPDGVSEAQFLQVIKGFREDFRFGHTFQFVLRSDKFHPEKRHQFFELWKTLRSDDRAPYMFYIPYRESLLVGTSYMIFRKPQREEKWAATRVGTQLMFLPPFLKNPFITLV
eukprot:tig00000821_g4491.t1